MSTTIKKKNNIKDDDGDAAAAAATDDDEQRENVTLLFDSVWLNKRNSTSCWISLCKNL